MSGYIHLNLLKNNAMKYRCLYCGRSTFDKPNVFHKCCGNYRKRRHKFEPVTTFDEILENNKDVLIRMKTKSFEEANSELINQLKDK